MAIEFHCTNCRRRLRVDDTAAGKRAKCPECGAIMDVPSVAATPIEAVPVGGGAPPVSPTGSPFGPGGPQPRTYSPAENPSESPFAPGASPFAFAPPAAEIRRTLIEVGDVFGRSWTILKANFGMCLLTWFVVWLISCGVNMVAGIIPILGLVAAILFGLWIGIGQALFFLKTARGQRAELGDIFTGGPYFANVLLAELLLIGIVFGVLLVSVVPLLLIGLAISEEAAVALGIAGGVIAFIALVYVMLAFSQFFYLIIDRNVGPVEALKMSKELTQGNKLTLVWIGILCFLLTIVAMIPCGLGLLVAAPYFAVMYAVIYLAMTGQPTAADRLAVQPPTGSVRGDRVAVLGVQHASK